MRVFVTGGTGFVGGHIIEELKSRKHQIVALVRRAGSIEGVEEIVSDITSSESLDVGKIRGCDATIHLVGIIRQFPNEGITYDNLHLLATKNAVEASRQAGVERFLHMSALGAKLDSQAKYHITKAQAEEFVKTSDLKWTIFRPCLILGKKAALIDMLTKMVKRHVVPLVGIGSSPVAPVAISTVAEAFAQAAENDVSIGKTYELAGEVFSYRTMLEELSGLMGKKALYVKVPVPMMRRIARSMERFKWFPLSAEQVDMMMEALPPKDYQIYDDLQLEFKNMEEVITEALDQTGRL